MEGLLETTDICVAGWRGYGEMCPAWIGEHPNISEYSHAGA